ncbi:peptidase M23B [Microbacterium esteraromaticum]|uniref:Peptidase M23B n=1 Tax=Microbacterium esteraromaticum TaxID=57043 RepID=A0A1R4KRJ7_9MICO|nr:M23 family metallopeptidase [Microbacterium esteraromaticum]SJN46976.1 peptidase M23B [Microbacterium esteraromaticum]
MTPEDSLIAEIDTAVVVETPALLEATLAVPVDLELGTVEISPDVEAVDTTIVMSSRRARRMAQRVVPAVPAEPVESHAPATDALPETPVAAEAPTVEALIFDLPDAEDTAASDSDEAAASDVDVFAAASELFGFAPIDESAAVAAAEIPEAAEPVTVGAAPVVPHIVTRRQRVVRRVAAAGASFGIMGVAGLIAVSMTLPASASAVAATQRTDAPSAASLVASTDATKAKKVEDGEIQAFVASDGVQDEALARSDSFSTVSLLDVAAEEGIRYSDSLYTNDPDAAIQWPFMVGVAMSSGYGERWGRLHAGIDLVPGAGAPIQVIADGTVRIATESGGAYGVTVYVDHVIDGQVVTSHYAHMQHGSIQVQVGQKVKVGDIIGKVGNTGRSYGAHLHFEIIINGSTVNPLTWMRENAGRYEY